jgi:hypothetical protein
MGNADQGISHCHPCERFYSLVRAAAEVSSMRTTGDICSPQQIEACESACRFLTGLFDSERMPKGFA